MAVTISVIICTHDRPDGLKRTVRSVLAQSRAAAEIIIVNTCGFIEPAKQESIDTILDYAHYKEEGSCQRLIVMGCLAQRYAEELRTGFPEVDGVFGLNRDEEILGRIREVVAVENTLSLGTSGGYSGEEAIDAEYDLLRANTDYALLGYMTTAECAVVRYRGPFTGNLGVGGPGDPALRHMTVDWFMRLSQAYDLPLIPVFNAADKSNLLIDGAQDENGTDTTVTTILAQLD